MTAHGPGGSTTITTTTTAPDLWQGLVKTCKFPWNYNTASGAGDAETNQLSYVTVFDCIGVRLVFSSTYGIGETIVGLGDITLAAAVQVGSTVYEATFNGQKRTTLHPRSFVVSDPIMVPVATGTTIGVRTYMASDTGWPITKATLSGDAMEGNNRGIAAADLTHEGDAQPTAVPAGAVYGAAPSCVLGIPKWTVPHALVGIGDSITSDASWMEYAFLNNGIPFVNCGIGTGTASAMTTDNGGRIRRVISKHATDIIIAFGTNDLASGSNGTSTVVGNLQSLWDVAAATGARVWGVTITPRTSSTDAFATTVNQTTATGFNENGRQQINDWIRTTPAPLTGYFEIADQVESSRNTGKWTAGKTDDGVHPNSPVTVGTALSATAIARFPITAPTVRTTPGPGPLTALPTITSGTYWEEYNASLLAGTDGDLIQTLPGLRNSRDLTQATSGNRPTLVGKGQAYRKMLRFNRASANYMRTAALTLNQPATIFLAIRRGPLSYTGATEILLCDQGSGQVRLDYTNATSLRAGTGGTLPTVTLGDTGMHVVTFFVDGASTELRRDGSNTVTGTISSANLGGLTIGAGFDASLPASVDVGQIVVCAGHLNTTDRAAIEAVLKTNWETP